MQVAHIQALMVDLDGTMVDTMADFEAALNLALADIDLPKVAREVVNIAVGKGSVNKCHIAYIVSPHTIIFRFFFLYHQPFDAINT